jgi:hypothetical protein
MIYLVAQWIRCQNCVFIDSVPRCARYRLCHRTLEGYCRRDQGITEFTLVPSPRKNVSIWLHWQILTWRSPQWLIQQLEGVKIAGLGIAILSLVKKCYCTCGTYLCFVKCIQGENKFRNVSQKRPGQDYPYHWEKNSRFHLHTCW